MSPEKSNQGKIGLWMKFIVPNELSHQEAIERSKAIAELRYEGVEVADDDAIKIGTIVEFPIQISGVREPKHEDDMTPQEIQAKMWQDEYLDDVEVEGDY